MAKGKGYVYIMTTAVNGIIKIGQSKDWTARCKEQLEENGYKNMNGLKTFFVVEVPDMDEYEGTMHDIFRESRVISRKENGKDTATELFAVDKKRAERVLKKMGTEVYPVDRRKENSVKNSTTEESIATSDKPSKKPNRTFEEYGVPVGTKLIFANDETKVVEVVDNKNKVKFEGQIYAISKIASIFRNYDGPSCGFYWFKYNGIRLTDLKEDR